jgi:hypothetical protein
MSGSDVTALLRLALIALVPAALVAALGLIARLARMLRARLSAAHGAPPMVPPRRPIEAVAADVRRLAWQCARVPDGAPQARRRGVQAAYEDVLLEAAVLLDVPTTLRQLHPGPGREAERVRLEEALAAAGLVMRR